MVNHNRPQIGYMDAHPPRDAYMVGDSLPDQSGKGAPATPTHTVCTPDPAPAEDE
ncbi:hypothetical protein [Kitasatospora aureofaciens]|uniref:hypothetical protein n=1 Tax=Kitasatospora aureofaciens TaxID=1894 RepID=UPI003807C7B6